MMTVIVHNRYQGTWSTLSNVINLSVAEEQGLVLELKTPSETTDAFKNLQKNKIEVKMAGPRLLHVDCTGFTAF